MCTCTHTAILMAIFLGKPQLACCTFDSPSPGLCTLLAQAHTLKHILDRPTKSSSDNLSLLFHQPTMSYSALPVWYHPYIPHVQLSIYFSSCFQSLSSYSSFQRVMALPGRPKNWGHFVLRLVTLEILIRSASNLAHIKIISFLTLNCNLFESSLENKVVPSSEWLR